MDLVTNQMDEALQRLQRVKSFDFPAAYEAAYTGISGIDPRGDGPYNAASADIIYGRTLAFQLWKSRNVLSTSW